MPRQPKQRIDKVSTSYSLFTRGDTWFFAYRVNGKLVKKTTRQTDEKRADEIAKLAWLEAKRLGQQAGFNAMTAKASECFKVFVDRRLKDKSEKDKAIFANYARRFYDFFGDIPLMEVSTFRVEDFRDWLLKQNTLKYSDAPEDIRWKKPKTLSPKTVRQMLHWLSSIYRYHKINPNPCIGVKPPEYSKEQTLARAIRFYTPEETENIFKASKGLLFELPLQILWHSGLRPAELKYLKNDDRCIDRARKTITVIDKKKEVRTLDLGNNPYTMKAWDALIEWIDKYKIKKGACLFNQTDTNWFNRRWDTVLHKAGMTYVMLHAVRHQFVKYAFHELGWELSTISQWCGHKTDMCYQTYSRVLVQSPKGNKTDVVISPGKKESDIRDQLTPEQRVIYDRLIARRPKDAKYKAKIRQHAIDKTGPFAPAKDATQSDKDARLAQIAELERQLAELRQSV